MAGYKKGLARILGSAEEGSRKFRKKDLSMAKSFMAGASSEKARMEMTGTEQKGDFKDKSNIRVPRGSQPKPKARDMDVSRTLAKRRVRSFRRAI